MDYIFYVLLTDCSVVNGTGGDVLWSLGAIGVDGKQ